MPYVGSFSPETLELVITDDGLEGPPFDFSDVTTFAISIKGPNGTFLWDWAIQLQTADELRLIHTYELDGSDLRTAGTYEVFGTLDTLTSRRRLIPAFFTAVPYP